MTLDEYRAERAATKRAAILDAAEESFRKEGFARTSMEAVANNARVSTATLYRYFPAKPELFEAVAGRLMDRLTLEIPDTNSPLDQIRELARAYARLLAQPDTIGIFRMVVAEIGRDASLAERFYAAVKSRLSDLFVGAIEIATKEGLLHPIPDPGAVAGQLQGMIEHATLMRGLVLGDHIDTRREVVIIADQALDTWMSRWVRNTSI